MPSSDTSSILYRIGQSVTNKITEETESAGGWQEIKAGTTYVSWDSSVVTYISLTDSIAANDVVAIQQNTGLGGEGLGTTSQIHIVTLGGSSFSQYGTILYGVRNSTSSLSVGLASVWRQNSTTIAFNMPQYFYNGTTYEYDDTIYVGKIWKLTGRTGV